MRINPIIWPLAVQATYTRSGVIVDPLNSNDWRQLKQPADYKCYYTVIG